jgi:prepilin-type N-terminal cleavage/methylation domain-containing protein
MNLSHLRKDNGFTLVELLVASTLTAVVLGGAVA